MATVHLLIFGQANSEQDARRESPWRISRDAGNRSSAYPWWICALRSAEEDYGLTASGEDFLHCRCRSAVHA